MEEGADDGVIRTAPRDPVGHHVLGLEPPVGAEDGGETTIEHRVEHPHQRDQCDQHRTRDQHRGNGVGGLAPSRERMERRLLDRPVESRGHTRPFPPTTARAAEFTRNVSTNSTRPAAM
ncbi:Uncharacterised protein [Mycobacteroides abscessus subsp. massiliense]|nr:Uncharacterised protein [Mycobacteroides abscessus subsp. massiliense]